MYFGSHQIYQLNSMILTAGVARGVSNILSIIVYVGKEENIFETSLTVIQSNTPFNYDRSSKADHSKLLKCGVIFFLLRQTDDFSYDACFNHVFTVPVSSLRWGVV